MNSEETENKFTEKINRKNTKKVLKEYFIKDYKPLF